MMIDMTQPAAVVARSIVEQTYTKGPTAMEAAITGVILAYQEYHLGVLGDINERLTGVLENMKKLYGELPEEDGE
jgi:hypothetical protein